MRWICGFLFLDTLIVGWSSMGVGGTLMMLALFGVGAFMGYD